MISLNNISRVYLIGIGGIGMSALARYFKSLGCTVNGYDKTPSRLTKELESEGIIIHFEENIKVIDKEAQLVIYTPAIPEQHAELVWYKENSFNLLKRSDVLKLITENQRAICVAGTHGKTTVSSMIAHLLTQEGFGANAFLGGIAANYDTNYIKSENDCVVVEADEYDRSFLKLFPDISVVTSMDADHLDIYGTAEEMEKAYYQFVNSSTEVVFYKHGLKQASNFTVKEEITYSAQNDAATYYAQNVTTKNGSYQFEICTAGEVLTEVTLNMGGMHNVENCIAAFGVAHYIGLDIQKLAAAIENFKGVRRRFEYVIKNENQVYIDDYAHHPEELTQLIKSTNSLFRNKKVSVVFQPHLFSRTKDHAEGFARALDLADEVILLDVYPARELPLDGVSSQMILDKMGIENKHILSKEGSVEWAKNKKPQVLITAGAGDIDQLVEPIKKVLS
jgi:UDP-N-acetylmuramate--alanine ligase